MLILAIDTCEARGSISLFAAARTIAQRAHEGEQDYSSWLLPAVDAVLADAQTCMSQLDAIAVATGPGSFTGLRVGLTTVKAWAEVYAKPIIGVSRLEALSQSSDANSAFVAAFYNAYRGQLFAALYRAADGRATRVGDELVISPPEFLEFVDRSAGRQPVSWVSLDPQMITELEAWKPRERIGDTMHLVTPVLSPAIAELASERAADGKFSDPLQLDANYVRRSDAELFWKGVGGNVR